jgi:methionine sulfoxide reductase heme-binding subunit
MSMPPATRTTNQPLGGARGDWRHRLLRFHLPLALVTVGVITLWMSFSRFQATGHQGPPPAATQTRSHEGASQAGDHAGGHQGQSQTAGTSPAVDHAGNQSATLDGRQDRLFMARFTTATGYVATGLLALTLLIGPANLLLRRRNPVSSYLRRDVGTWTAIISVVHVIVGFSVHGPAAPLAERVLAYFFAPEGRPLTNSFGLGNWTGLAATVIVVGLLALSSNFALRKLKARPWKWLQRLNYALFVLVVMHALFYSAGMRAGSPYTLLLLFSVIAVCAGQGVGVWLWRQRHARTTVG